MDCFVHLCGGKTEEEYQLKETELAARSNELKSEQDNSFKLSKNLEEETKSKNAEIALKKGEETAKKKAITRGHMESMGKKITAVMKDQKTDQIKDLVSEMEKLQQMMEDERQAHAAEKAALESVQASLEQDKADLEQRVRNFQQALAKTGGESLRLCRELSDDSVAPWAQAEKTAGLANIVSEDLSASLRGLQPQWENLAPSAPAGVPPAAAKLEPKLSPMHSACREGDKKKVKGILRDLAEQSLVDECLSSKDSDGKTPLDLCIANGHSELHEYLAGKASPVVGTEGSKAPTHLPPVEAPPPPPAPPVVDDGVEEVALPSMGSVEEVALPGAVN